MLLASFLLRRCIYIKQITREMIKLYNIRKIGCDFMGYSLDTDMSFHHLIVPKRDCIVRGLGNGEFVWNGAILVQHTSHDYLHTIEHYDLEIFNNITSEMIDENLKGKVDVENLRHIRDLLMYFEKEASSLAKKKILKRDFIEKRVLK